MTEIHLVNTPEETLDLLAEEKAAVMEASEDHALIANHINTTLKAVAAHIDADNAGMAKLVTTGCALAAQLAQEIHTLKIDRAMINVLALLEEAEEG